MAFEWEGEVEIEEDFSSWGLMSRVKLACDILRGRQIPFTGYTHIEIDPPDRS